MRVILGSKREASVCVSQPVSVLGVLSTGGQTPCTNQLGPRFEHLHLMVVFGEVGLLIGFSTDPFSPENKLLNLTVGDQLWVCDVS